MTPERAAKIVAIDHEQRVCFNPERAMTFSTAEVTAARRVLDIKPADIRTAPIRRDPFRFAREIDQRSAE